jgi:hypothetical protein
LECTLARVLYRGLAEPETARPPSLTSLWCPLLFVKVLINARF